VQVAEGQTFVRLLVKRHFRRYGDSAKTAAKYGINVRDLNARARREGWAA
jgi:hypothetical protein